MALKIDRARAQAAVQEFLLALGQTGETVSETAARVTSAFADELLRGYGVDLKRLLLDGSEPCDERYDPVVLDGVATATVCPHHLLVAKGTALVAYVPGKRVLGLGTISHLVDACSRRLVLQESIARDITTALMEHAGAEGAFCRIVLDHACLQTRGALQPEARAISWSGAGSLAEPTALESVLGRALSEV